MNQRQVPKDPKASDGLTIVPKTAIGIGICFPVLLGFTTDLKGFYSWAELVGLAGAGVLAFHNYNNYINSLKLFPQDPDTSSCITKINYQFFACIGSFIICEIFVLFHAPPALIMLLLSGVYFFYLHSNITALKFMYTQRHKLSSLNMHDRFVNTIASLAYFLKADNSLSYIGYLILTVLCAVVSISSQSLNLLSPSEADGLNAFAAGAAVVHLGISAIAFSNVFRTYTVPAGAAKAALSDTIELTLFVVGSPASIQTANGRSDRASAVAEILVNRKMFGFERSKVLTGSFLMAALFAVSVVAVPRAVSAFTAEPSKSLPASPADARH